MKENRLSHMEEFILSREFVSLDELCNTFGKSKNTIRRDVAELIAGGTVQKVYGGVKPIVTEPKLLVPYQDRNVKHTGEKAKICAAAAGFIQDGDVVFLDSGSTTVGMVEHLAGLRSVTVLTNNLFVVIACMERPGINLIVLGGQFNRNTASFSSNFCSIDNLRLFNINKAFMSATGVSIAKGATHTSSEELTIKKSIVERSDDRYLLADHSKFGQAALLTYAGLKEFQYVITDQTPTEEYTAYFERESIGLVVCNGTENQ